MWSVKGKYGRQREEMQTLISEVPQHLEVRRNWSLKISIQEGKKENQETGWSWWPNQESVQGGKINQPGQQSQIQVGYNPQPGYKRIVIFFSFQYFSSSLGGSGEKEEYLHFFKLPLTAVCLFRFLNLCLRSDSSCTVPFLLPHHYTGDLLGHPLP